MDGVVWFTIFRFILLFFAAAISVMLIVHSYQYKPYMDEIFHVPQAQRYCEGNFLEWDPMITTLPGLYINTVAIMRPISWLLDVPMAVACSTFCLRIVNVAFSTANCILFIVLTRALYLYKTCNWFRCLATAGVLSFFPLLYFFTFLYYTDAGSTFWVLLMYYFNLKRRHLPAGLAGAMAVLFRQTNVVWVVFCAGISVEKNIIDWIQPKKKDISPDAVQKFDFLFYVMRRLWTCMTEDVRLVRPLVARCVSDIWPYGSVCVAFITFVWHNGSIVVGAKDDHQVSINFPQLFYFATFSAGFSFMHLLSPTKINAFFRFLYKRPVAVFLFVLLSTAVIWQFTVAHKYLLADNRHYTFYIWANVYRRHTLVKYILIPGYLFAIWGMLLQLQHQSGLWKLVYITCVCINLVPQMLFEFRYFITPYLIYRLNMKPTSYRVLTIEMAFYVAINTATIYLFLEKTFRWPGQDEEQRFMW